MDLLHQREEIQAQQIREAIEKGQNIDFNRVRILGDLSLSDEQTAREPKRITSQVKLNSCVFEGLVHFPKAIFCQEVSFSGSYFHKDVIFWPGSTEFQKKANFSHTIFYGKADFSYVKFKDKTTFQEAVFHKNGDLQAEFSHTRFDDDVDFICTKFDRKAVFLGSRFKDKAEFSSDTRFSEVAQFDDARFYETPWFYDCKFLGNAEFNRVTFYRDAIFSHSTFDKDFRLNGSKAGIIYFEGLETKSLLKSESRIGIADLREINKLLFKLRDEQDPISVYIKNKLSSEMNALISTFNGANQLDSSNRVKFLNEFNEIIFNKSFLEEKPFRSLKLSEITKRLLNQGDDDPRLNRLIIEDAYPDLITKNETLFGIKLDPSSSIFLEGSYFGLLQIHWHILEKHLDKDIMPSVYLSLIRSYHELGWANDEDDCYFYYRSLRNKNKISKATDKFYNRMLNRLDLSKYIDPIASISCGYGVCPGRTISLSLGMILAFASLYWAKCTFWLSLGGDGLVDRTQSAANVTVLQFSNGVFQTIYTPCNNLTNFSLLDSIYAIPNALYLSAMIFMSQVPSNWYVNGYWKYVIMSERVIGWLLMALFIVVLTKKLIR